jgi:hypothetical protein
MAVTISRVPLNALVDDDGSNTTGSVWNKAAIASVLMDPIDAMMAGFHVGTTAWTPSLKFGGASVGMTYTTQAGLYVKNGPEVYITFRITLSAAGSSTGGATITGLPFTVNATALIGFQSIACSFSANMVNAAGMMAYTILNTTTLQLTVPNGTGTGTTNMIQSNFGNTSDFIISGSYLATA